MMANRLLEAGTLSEVRAVARDVLSNEEDPLDVVELTMHGNLRAFSLSPPSI